MRRIAVALVHYPILARDKSVVTTAITNLDIHDIARTCRTFGYQSYFIITPIKRQQGLVGRILRHWESDKGNEYNPDRSDALSEVELVDSIEVAQQKIEQIEGVRPFTVVTGANFENFDGDMEELTQRLKLDDRPMFLLFGTGWGLTEQTTESADFKLDPIFGLAKDGYNHLSVRSAVAIYGDRLARALKK